MCGIAGIFDTKGRREVDEDALRRMNNAQVHRGPDEEGYHREPGLGLAHRRLSIIDLSGGQQPLFNEDGSVAVVYNGEIYNFQDLRQELLNAGHVFCTRSDTEVIVHAWEEWGEDCICRFRGMFAFGIWDRRKQILFLGRDRLGIKPLYYTYLPDGRLLFASELKGLLAYRNLPREVDPRAVEDYFAYGYIPEPKSILRGICKLAPGHTLSAVRGAGRDVQREYWDVPFGPRAELSAAAAQEELVLRLKEAVRMRLVAEVPLGAFLSGGVDSSAVVALMAESSSDPVITCSIAFNDPQFNEAEFAGKVAARYRTRHYVETVDTDDFTLIDDLAGVYDEPFADSSAIPTYRVCQLGRRHVVVALSGDGGDENLAGYRRYRWYTYEQHVRNMIPSRIRRALFGTLAAAYPKADWAPKFLRAKATLEAMARDPIEGYFHSVSIAGDSLRRQLFTEAFRRSLQGYHAIEVLRSHAARAPTDDPLSRVQYLDIKTYLAGDILTKVDRASMAHSLEVRVPILDHELVEWISALPPEMKLNGSEGKYIFKQAMRGYLPDNTLYRKKMGFSVPLASWFRGPLRARVRQALLDGPLASSGMFCPAFLARLVDQHQSGRRDNSALIWSLLVYDAFQKRVLGA